MSATTYFLRQDDSAHWYLIPETELVRFSDLMEEIPDDEDACDLFIGLFDKYRLSGGPENLPIEREQR
jgi:hypothetical protein